MRNDPDATDSADPGSSATGVRWDLAAIHPDGDSAKRAVAQALERARELRSAHEGKVAELGPDGLSRLLIALGQVLEEARAAFSYCELRASADSLAVENQDLRASAERTRIEFGNATRFFDLEWQRLDPATARSLAASPEVAAARYHLERLTARAAHSLSAEVEEALSERSSSAVSAWQELFTKTTSAITVSQPSLGGGRPHTLDEVVTLTSSPSGATRRAAFDAVFEATRPWLPVLASVYDALVSDRLTMDRLRGYAGPGPHPMSQTNLQNDLPDASVDSLLDEVQARYPLAQRYFAGKARFLGVERLELYDLYAPLGESPRYDYEEARALVAAACGSFAPVALRSAERFFAEERIDAEPRRGKQGGAFCEGVSLTRPSYVLLSYGDSLRDVQTLAHELGHGLHNDLAKGRQGPFGWEPALVIAEAASTFQEMLLFDLQLRRARQEARWSLLCARIDRSLNTLFAQTMMTRYEQRAYLARDGGESLNPDRLTQIWTESARQYFGEAVALPESYGTTWARIPHFVFTRFYTYAYSFAHLASLALYAAYQADPTGFVPHYLDLLADGGAAPPQAILARCGIDIANDSWMDAGFSVLAAWIDEAAAGPGREP